MRQPRLLEDVDGMTRKDRPSRTAKYFQSNLSFDMHSLRNPICLLHPSAPNLPQPNLDATSCGSGNPTWTLPWNLGNLPEPHVPRKLPEPSRTAPGITWLHWSLQELGNPPGVLWNHLEPLEVAPGSGLTQQTNLCQRVSGS